MRTFLAVLCSLQFALAAVGQEVKATVMPKEVVVDPQTNTASATIVLENEGEGEANVVLVADDFRAEGGVAGLGAQTLFGLGDEAPTRSEQPIKIPAGEQRVVRTAISNLRHAGIATAALMNRGADLGTRLVAVKAQLPFNVAPVGWKEGTSFIIRFEKGEGPLLFLKNDDPVDYLVTWSLSTPGLTPKRSTEPLLVQAQSAQEIQIPVDGWLPSSRDLGALLKNVSSPGSLRLAATSETGKRTWKTRDLAVTIERSYWSPTQQTFRSFFFLALLVVLGGIMSIIVTHGLPNRLRRIAVAESIKSITPKIRDISSENVQSALRTSVRVERTRLLQRLRSRSTISPDFANLVRECEAATALLEREIDLLDSIDADMRRIETTWPTAGLHGPTLLQKACVLLTDAQRALERPEMNDDVVAKAGAKVQQAEATIDNASTLDTPSMESLKERLKKLGTAGPWKECETGKRIIAEVPGLTPALAADPQVTESSFAELDTAAAKLDFVRRFVELCEKAKGSSEKSECIEEFIAALRRGGFNDFRMAEGLTAQMREGVFPKQVADEIRAGRYRLDMEPQVPSVNQAVAFTVVFDYQGVKSSAARHAITCTWEFFHAPAPDHASWIVRLGRRLTAGASAPGADWKRWTESGLSVSHYFPTAGKFDVTVAFKDEKGNAVESPSDACKIKVDVEEERLGWLGERTKVEYSRLAIVLIITVAGLLVGARDELAKLDLVPGLIAVFMLGFTADQIKNILAPPASP